MTDQSGHTAGAKSPASAMLEKADNPLLGIGFMLAFCVFIPFSDGLVKILGQSVPLLTLLVARFSFQVLFLTPVMLYREKGWGHVRTLSAATWWRLFWRTVMHAAGMVGMYFGLQFMPLADTTAIAFIFPILMLFAGYFFLKEQVGPHRVVAALVGFLGTLLVVQPNFVAVGLNALWPIGVALTFVVFMLVTRQMSREIDPISIQVVSGWMALVALAVVVPLLSMTEQADFRIIWPSGEEMLLLTGVGIIGTFGHLLMTAAVRFTPSATLAPMQYLEIPFATLIGWLIFSELPNLLATVGILVTISSGIYMIFREQRSQRLAQMKAQQAKAASA